MRMVALVTLSPSLCVVVMGSGSFFQVYLPGVFVLRRTIAPRVSVSEMHPHFVVAALVFFLKTKRAVGICPGVFLTLMNENI